MSEKKAIASNDFEMALKIGRPPNVKKLFPYSRALIVSGKFIDRAMLAKGNAMAMAANGRNNFVIRGALQAAQRANAPIIIEIARSEGGAKEQDINPAKIEIPTLFEAGMTSIAIDASHLPDDKNLLANLELNPYVPEWAGLETEVGEIKGKEGLSTVEEALFLVQGLNANDISPDWIALNNGTTHGIEASGQGIQVGLTAEIHQALAKYKISGAQHGTSGNSSDRLREIVANTRTTKANVATALQMISWGLEVNDYGNAILDDSGNFIKLKDQGVTQEMWAEMVAYAQAHEFKGGNYKKLNLPFENKLLGQVETIRTRMVKQVEAFVYNMLVNVFNAQDSAPLAIEAILKAGTYDPGRKAERIENPDEWTPEKIVKRAASITSDKGAEGDFDD
ncbi:MAG: class II fructose-bisphosphate aldolase [Deltaproteobacteria bacterium]|nr:class II fructose-bisphosphate aldolase [Deltaproteobacteria bacterium]